VPRTAPPELRKLVDPRSGEGDRSRWIIDDPSVRGQDHVRRAVADERARKARRDLALEPGVRPLRRRERPDLPVRMDEVSRECERAAVDLDEVADGADGMTWGRKRVDVEAADAAS